MPFLAPQIGLQVCLALAELLLLRLRNCCFPPTSSSLKAMGRIKLPPAGSQLILGLIPACWGSEERQVQGVRQELTRAVQGKWQSKVSSCSSHLLPVTVCCEQRERKGRYRGGNHHPLPLICSRKTFNSPASPQSALWHGVHPAQGLHERDSQHPQLLGALPGIADAQHLPQ